MESNRSASAPRRIVLNALAFLANFAAQASPGGRSSPAGKKNFAIAAAPPRSHTVLASLSRQGSSMEVHDVACQTA
jgi:hypothetical protein